MQFLILHVDRLIGKDIPLFIILELIATNLAHMVVLAAPMAVLVASLMAFGKFSELNELTALRASGVNPFTIIRPVLFASVIMAVFLVWFSNNVLPEANSKARSLFIDIRVKKPGFDLKPNVFYNGIDGFTFLVKEIDSETDSLYNITLFQEPQNTRKRAYIRAEKGFLISEGSEGLTLLLHNGEITRYLRHSRVTGSSNHEKSSFDQYRLTFDLRDLEFSRSDPSRRGNSDRTMSAKAMSAVVDSLQAEILEYGLQTSQNSSFDYLYEKAVPNPINPMELLVENPAATDSSDFYMLSLLENEIYKKRMLDLANRDLEKEVAWFENISGNILWRFKRINRYMVEIYKKYSIPAACVVFVIVGAPIGMMTRKGNFGIAAIISSVVLTIYWISIIQGEKMADRLFITPFVGMWAFNIIFGAIGTILILQLSTEMKISKLLKRSS